mmetsp:Transcript_33765/g.68713  ORF Transcript_33765/g.68713 Transcript_33765/m.68713 type:complete len:457 (-) Transcript_33765:3640-5010(-)
MENGFSTGDHLHQILSQLIDDELCDASASSIDAADLKSVAHHIGLPFHCDTLVDDVEDTHNGVSMCIMCSTVDLRRRMNLIKSHMGSMAQCRGARGESLREAGAIDSVLSIVWRLISSSNEDNIYSITLPSIENVQSSKASYNAFDVCCERHSHLRDNNNHLDFNRVAIKELHSTAIDLASVALGSLRDLACGSALNRAAFLSWEPPASQTFNSRMVIENGVHVLVTYIQRYDGLSWEDILYLDDYTNTAREKDATGMYTARGRKEIRILTNALGAIRNSSHSTADVCQSFYTHSLVDLLMWRLVHNASTANSNGGSVLPDASKPWREACFRTAGSLINLAEKCHDVAIKLASNRNIIYVLLETWGGTNAITVNNERNKKSLRGLPLLHLGLAAVLNAAAENTALEGGLDDIMIQVLEKEKERKQVAQRREEERKLRMKKAALPRDTDRSECRSIL